MKVFYLYVSPRKEKETLYHAGKYPDTLFYGLFALRKHGFKINYSDEAFSSHNLWQVIFYPMNWLFVYLTGYGFKLGQAVLLLPKLKNSDIIITCGSSAGLPLALFRLLGLVNKPVICIHTGGAEKVENPLMAALLKRLYSRFDQLVVFSRSEEKLLVKKFNLHNVSFMPLGIDTKFFRPQESTSGGFYLSVGRDLGRDFDFLFKVFGELKLPLKVVTSKRNVQGLDIPGNVEVLFDVPYVQLKDLYNQAKAVVLALKPEVRATGQLVFLESLAMGKPVIVTNTPGLLSGYEDLGRAVTLAPCGDKEGFMRSVRNLDLKSGKIGQRLVRRKYDSEQLGKKILKLVRQYE